MDFRGPQGTTQSEAWPQRCKRQEQDQSLSGGEEKRATGHGWASPAQGVSPSEHAGWTWTHSRTTGPLGHPKEGQLWGNEKTQRKLVSGSRMALLDKTSLGPTLLPSPSLNMWANKFPLSFKAI